MTYTQYKFKALQSLDKLREIRGGEVIGIGQHITDTIPAKCLKNNGKEMELLGNQDDKLLILYSFKIEDIKGFYEDGSLIRGENCKTEHIYPKDERFENGKKNLYESKLWGLLK